MPLKFAKYQGTGNDFILFDNRDGRIAHDDTQWVQQICDRRFGIGADGVMLLEELAGYDFKMVYYNSDGNISSMCGNGGRCMVAFAERLGIVRNQYRFMAVDGEHIAFRKGDQIHLQMLQVTTVEQAADHCVLNTGSPHYVTFTHDIMDVDIRKEGAAIRYSERFAPGGINVNFLEEHDGMHLIRTYERGVEDETLSCGTGVTASALVLAIQLQLPLGKHTLTLQTMGGKLQVAFNRTGATTFDDIWLIGPGTFVFEGDIVYP